jgi:metallo-beta-lactamase family protein
VSLAPSHLVNANGLTIMVDCGLAQGNDASVPIDNWPVSPKEIDYLFLTHAHIDHIGRLPELIQKGFNGEIICSHPTKALLHPMLADAMNFSGLPEQTAASIEKDVDDLSWGFEYGQTFDLKKGITFKLGRAGHILGSCFIRFQDESTGWAVIFSGDLGATDTPILPDPEPPEAADLVILESTYGDRLHGRKEQRVRQLGNVLTRTLADKGKAFIPAFSLGRTQEILYEMDRIFSDPQYQMMFPGLQHKNRPPVFIDSPLGLEITNIYSGLSDYWDKEAKDLYRKNDSPMDFDGLYAVKDHKDHLKVCEIKGPAVILAGSGMCTGGRIIDHLLKGIENPENDIIFVGYQTSVTPGRTIQECAKKFGGYVKLEGERMEIKADVHTLTGYSPHADQKGLLDWVESMSRKPKTIKLVHGAPQARSALAALLERKGYTVQGER